MDLPRAAEQTPFEPLDTVAARPGGPALPVSTPGAAPIAVERATDPAPGGRILESRELLAGDNEVRIRHGVEYYRLRLTQNGKLILQK
jgi:hemin uptake protein HemP